MVSRTLTSLEYERLKSPCPTLFPRRDDGRIVLPMPSSLVRKSAGIFL